MYWPQVAVALVLLLVLAALLQVAVLALQVLAVLLHLALPARAQALLGALPSPIIRVLRQFIITLNIAPNGGA